MPSHYDDGEYKGSEHATDVFKAPTPEPIPETEGQKLEKRPEDYIDTGELNEDGEPLHWSGWPLHLLGKVGDAFESVDKAVLGKIGTEDANLYTARRGSIDALSEQHFVLGLLGEIFIPDTVDIATAGLAYIPNRFRKLGKAGIKLWAKLNKGGMAADSVRLSKLEAQKLFNYEVDEFGNLGQAFAHTGDFNRSSDDLTEEILRLSMPKTAAPNPTTGSRGFIGTTSFDGVQYTKTTLDPEFKIPWNLVNNPQEKGRRLAGAFTDQASDPKKWHELNNAIKARMENLYPGWDIPLKPGQKSIGGWAGHHTAPVKQIAWAVNGLDNKARNAAADYISKAIGQRLGFSPENLREIPAEFHKYVHRMLNDAMGTYDISTIEKTLGLKPGGFADLELWDRKKGFDMIIDNLLQSKKDIEVFMSNLAIQSKHTDVSPEVLVDSMEELLDLQTKIRLNPKDPTLNQIINKFLGRSQEALKFVDDELPAAERPIKNMLYALALRDKEKAIEFARAQRGNKLKLDPQTGMRPDD